MATEKEQRIEEEKDRLRNILGDLSQEKMDIAEGLIDEVAFMRATLKDLKDDINANGAIDEMPQGDYSILRESPSVKTYNTMVQRYNGIYKELFSLLPKDVVVNDDDEFDKF